MSAIGQQAPHSRATAARCGTLVPALDDYDQHGRIHGAPPDQAMDQAANAYIASYLAGRT